VEISAAQTQLESLAALGIDAARLLGSGQFRQLADLFGYALAFGREPSAAIETDLAACLAELGASSLAAGSPPPPTVTFFEPGSGLVAAIECLLPTHRPGTVSLELVVTAKGAHRHVTLEQLTAVA
jgi:hypothetical protein